MKKIFLTVIVVLLAVTTVSAQYKGDWGVGPKIGVYTNAGADGAIFGIGAAGQYSITDNWRVAPSILALCKTGCSVDISADVQYLFNIAPDWHIYPLAGISANDIGDWSCGINLGGGADFSITRNWDVSAGFKWMIQTAKDYVPGFVKRRNPIVINSGATYRFYAPSREETKSRHFRISAGIFHVRSPDPGYPVPAE